MPIIKSIINIILSSSPPLKKRLIGISILLLGFNGIIWLMILLSSRSYPLLFGLAALSYGFGLRHAVDADHIAAIDGTMRKLMQEGKRPVAVGFFFSLGHSTIVIALCSLVAISANFVQQALPAFKQTGSFIGAAVSALFLLAIGIINLLALIEIVSAKSDERLEHFLQNRGIVTRVLRPFLKMVQDSWHMYFIGFLFGLGFDTATEIGLLSISAASATGGIPIFSIILLPLAFTAGMTLIDTLNGILMLGAYGWAYMKPARKFYYNMNITFISLVTALFIGGVEALQIISDKLGLNGGIFALANKIEFGNLSLIIIAAFLASFLLSFIIYKSSHKVLE